MHQIIANFVGPVAGGLVSGGIGYWLSNFNHCRNGKSAFLLVTADQKSKFSEIEKMELDKFYGQSIPIMSQAVYRVLEFLNKRQKDALLKFWNEYRSEGEKLFGSQDKFLDTYLEEIFEGDPKNCLKW